MKPCCKDSDANMLYSLISDHVKGHSKLAINYKRRGITHICKDCLNELLMDSVWTTGFFPRLKFLLTLEESASWYGEESVAPIIESGYQNLSWLCPCNENKETGWSWGRLESSIHQEVQKKFLKDNNFPKKYRKSNYYGWLWCDSCTEKIEIDSINKIKTEDLPLYINTEWLTEKGQETFSQRFKK